MDKRQLVNESDVISVSETDVILVPHKTFRFDEFLSAMSDMSEEHLSDEKGQKWFSDGVECEILSPGNIWRKGKIKISLEFIPDEPESPLDEIRNHPSFSNTQ